jgi:hypothetical protein
LKNVRFVVFVCLIAFAVPALAQTTATNLVMRAHWDDGSVIQGTVTLGQINATGPDTVIAATTLKSGKTNVSEALNKSILYDVTLNTATGTQLYKFPITTALINPDNLQRAEIDLVFRKADNSIKSAQITVSLGF